MSLEIDVETLATIHAELAHSGASLGAVLARHGLDEAAFERASAAWEQALASLEDEPEAALLERYSRAFAAAQARETGAPAPFERTLAVMRGIARGETLNTVLEHAGLTLNQYLAAQQYWARRIVEDETLRKRFQAAMQGQ